MLSKCSNKVVGGPLVKGISGGERKRTSIGIELITNPSLLFLDEPTTGLDSDTALLVIKILRDLARQGRTVIQTIHQPNTDIYNNLDYLILMAQGKIIYFNQKEYALPYFKSLDFACPDHTNPADFFISIMSIESLSTEEDDETTQARQDTLVLQFENRIRMLVESYLSSEFLTFPCDSPSSKKEAVDVASKVSNFSWFNQFQILAWRNMIN